jgi:CHASE2 domain-containing sensor protein
MPLQEPRIPAWIHFGTGLIVISAAAVLSYSVHGTGIGRHLEMVNLDAWVRGGKTVVDPDIVVVQITDDDYKSDVFKRGCPLPVEGVSRLLHAVALSGPKVIVVDLDTSDWTSAQRAAVRAEAEDARRTLGPGQPAQIAWAIGGSQEAGGGKSDTGKLTLEPIDDPASCFGVPVAIPDEYGVVRGYLPYVPLNGQPIPSLAILAAQLSKGKGCTVDIPSPVGDKLPAEELIDYAGGPERFLHLTAGTVLGAADSSPWQNANPMQSKIAIVGGSFQEGRDRYVTPHGYLNGIDILAHAVASALRGGVREPTRGKFVLADGLLGMLLVTGSYFLHKYWLLAISFIAIPLIAFAASYLIFSDTGYFFSFVPVVAAVFLHHLIEHAVEHWRMLRELHELRAKLHP